MRHRVHELRAQGLGYTAVAREVGISASSVRRIVDPAYAERQRKLSRDAKRRRTGTCKVCGGRTTLRRFGGGPADVCGDCAADHYAPIQRAQRAGVGPVIERARALLADGRPVRRRDLVAALGITQGHASMLLQRLVKYGFAERIGRGLYQLCTTKPAPVSAADLSPHKERAQSVA